MLDYENKRAQNVAAMKEKGLGSVACRLTTPRVPYLCLLLVVKTPLKTPLNLVTCRDRQQHNQMEAVLHRRVSNLRQEFRIEKRDGLEHVRGMKKLNVRSTSYRRCIRE